jgi:phosphotransferase system HPr (HPr) family protein
MERVIEMTVIDTLGIHARPASTLAVAVKRSGATLRIRCGDRSADATSVVQLLSLGARHGSQVTIEIDGDDVGATTAESALSELFTRSTNAGEKA